MKFILIFTLLAFSIYSYGQTYPASKGNSTGYEYITNVSFNAINNTSDDGDADGDGDDGYDDFTSVSTNVSVGNTYTLSITINADSKDYITAWIDWNDDGDFKDTGEDYVIVTNTSSDGPHTVNITIPSGVANQNLRMRVTLKYDGAPISDESSFSYGEVEDYTITTYTDTDNDGIADRDDIDDDNDGITDATEAGVGCTTTEVYCGANNGNLYKVDFNAGTVTKMTTSTQTSGGINALASNPDDGVVYYGVGTIMYVYNPADGTHTQLKDFSSEITGANLESGGGAYFNGYLYIAPEDGDGYGTNIYKIPISNNGLTAGTAVSIGNPSGTNKGYGDFVIVNQGSAGIMYGQTSGSSGWEFWKYDLSNNNRTVISSGSSGGTWQLALDLYGRLWRGVNTDIQKIDFDGNPYGNIITATEAVYDMTGPFNCVQGDFSLDTDGDGIPNIIDLDSDGDGIPDNVEGQSTTGYTAPSGTDTDGDGLDDAYDPDNGGSFAGTINSDNDGDNDFLDVNSDNGGSNDTQEAGLTLSGNDSDGDGLDDNIDATSDYTDPNGTINNPSSLPDADGDVNSGGDVDYRDNFNGNNSDHDGDGIPDDRDIDDDNDGLTDAEEAGVSCDITEVYCGGNNGHMYKVDFNAETVTLMTTSDKTSGYINALASNPDDGVVYYGEGTNMYVYNPSDGSHTLLKDFSSEISGGNLESGGGAYLNGYLYIAPEDGSNYGTYIYKIPVSNNGMTLGTAVNIGNPAGTNMGYGDFVVINQGSAGMMYGQTSGSSGWEFWKYDLSDNTRTVISSGGSGGTWQLALDLYGRLWRGSGTDIQKMDFDGNLYGNVITASESISDMTGPFNCPQGGVDRDTDGDGVPDRLDLDSDNDGIADVIEAGGSDPDNDGIIGSGAITDTDGDGWSNIVDSDNGGTALANADTDGDGYKNTVDIDSDNDGIVDAIEGGGTDTDNNGVIGNGSFTDTDGDGWSDITDSDDGGTALTLPNTDGDAVVNYLDLDSDGDGIPDNVEAQSTTGYTSQSGTDTDKDGLDDAYDTDNSGSAIGNIDTDGDGTKDWMDTDSDNEGNNDTQEAGLTLAGADADGDGLDDNIDVTGDYSDPNGSINDPTTLPDADGDATSNGDVDYRDDTFTDSDGDGVADGFDDDDDNDGILDEDENTCISQQFLNGNFESGPFPSTYVITDASNVDGWNTTASDNKIEIWHDGYNSVPAYEGTYFSEINANEAARMYQTLTVLPGDVLKWNVAHRGRSGTDVMDIKVGPVGSPVTQQTASTDNTAWVVYQSNYTVPDGVTQIEIGFEAVSTASGDNSVGNFIDDIKLYLISSNYCDSDGDGVPNYLDLDSDNDGINDVIEAGGSDPDNDGRIGTGAITDTDGDGVSDIVDTDNGGTPLPEPDTDGDGHANFQDIDSDHDGIVDNIEGQATDSYTAPSGTDANSNGWDDAYDGNAGGTAIALVDTDGDGTPDYIDTNSDDDGGDDATEAYDTNKDGTTNTNPTNGDADGDGLDDAYDSDGTSTTDNGGPTNNGQTASSFPNDDNSTTSERDWREALSTLPVSLISFEAELKNDYVELNWATASEINNDYFIVQRSLDNKTFEEIARVSGNGNSNIIIEYQSYDMDLPTGIIYYRLKQVDYDGATDYSNIVAIRNTKDREVYIFPNPSNGNINIETQEAIDVVIYSVSGQQIANYHFEANTNNKIDISNQPKGIYFLSYISNNKSIIKKLIIR